MEKLTDAILGEIADEAKENPDAIYVGKVVAPLAADLFETRCELAALKKQLSDLCPIAYLPVIESLQAEKHLLMDELAALKDAVRWIPVSEKLPEVNIASNHVDVLYRYVDENGNPIGEHYYTMETQYWEKYGWAYNWEKGKCTGFEEYGFVVEFWRARQPLPLPPAPEVKE